MKIINYKQFDKWCESRMWRTDAILSAAERWNNECGKGETDFEYEDGAGAYLTIYSFTLVKKSVWSYDEDGDEIQELEPAEWSVRSVQYKGETHYFEYRDEE